jgi:hypothetical protein
MKIPPFQFSTNVGWCVMHSKSSHKQFTAGISFCSCPHCLAGSTQWKL